MPSDEDAVTESRAKSGDGDPPRDAARDAARDSAGGPTDEQLWSWIDRAAPELDSYLGTGPDAESRVAELRGAIGLWEAADPAAGLPERIGEYAIRGLLGRGGMGSVYDAEQTHPRRRVALKVLPAEVASDERRLALFRREADALARLSHPGIAVVFGVGRGDDGRPHIAMERVAGRTLAAYVAEERLGRRDLVQLVRKICEAVGHAHDQGVVHRDLKPANVIVNTRGEPVVVDFGLARIEDEELTRVSLATQAGSLLGTLPYMSPEQVAGHTDLKPSSDVYALGVLLVELLTGELPHELAGLSLVEAARRIQEEPPRLRGKSRRALRGDLGLVARKALEKDPRRRYSSAGELAADLQRFLDGRSVEAVRPALHRLALRSLRRHWIGAAFTLGGLVVVVLLLVPIGPWIPLTGDWWREGAPFEDLRWMGDAPEVRLDGAWYTLVAIDDLKSAYVVGFAQQHAGDKWRKRFSEDLVQVLQRMGHWGLGDVDLTLRTLDTGELLVRRGIPLDSDWRRAIYLRRSSWPWSPAMRDDHTGVRYEGAEWELISVDGVPAGEFRGGLSFDSYCDRVGRSPGETVDFVLRDPASGATRTFRDEDRIGAELRERFP